MWAPDAGGGTGRYRCTGCPNAPARSVAPGSSATSSRIRLRPSARADHAGEVEGDAGASEVMASVVGGRHGGDGAELEQMARDWGAGLLTRAEFYTAKETLLARIATATEHGEEVELPDVVTCIGRGPR